MKNDTLSPEGLEAGVQAYDSPKQPTMYAVNHESRLAQAIAAYLPFHESDREKKLRELIKEMQVANDMSHESFCDSEYWKDEFKRVSRQALTGEEA